MDLQASQTPGKTETVAFSNSVRAKKSLAESDKLLSAATLQGVNPKAAKQSCLAALRSFSSVPRIGLVSSGTKFVGIFSISDKLFSKKLLATLEEYEDIHRVLNVDTLYKLNKEIQEGRTENLILLSEALHEKKMANIADDIAKRPNVKMVLIAGPSSSGKTTFAKRLGIELRLNGLKPVTISVDNYFVEREDNPKDENGQYDFECLEAIDHELFNTTIKNIRL